MVLDAITLPSLFAVAGAGADFHYGTCWIHRKLSAANPLSTSTCSQLMFVLAGVVRHRQTGDIGKVQEYLIQFLFVCLILKGKLDGLEPTEGM